MRRLIAALALALGVVPAPAFAAGPFDGVWIGALRCEHGTRSVVLNARAKVRDGRVRLSARAIGSDETSHRMSGIIGPSGAAALSGTMADADGGKRHDAWIDGRFAGGRFRGAGTGGASSCDAALSLRRFYAAPPGGPIVLRTVYLENPRFDGLDDTELDALLAAAARVAKDHFAVDVKFTRPLKRPLKAFFADLEAALEPMVKAEIADFKGGKADWPRIADSIAKTMGRNPAGLDDTWQFAAPLLEAPVPAGRTAATLAEALTATMRKRITYWTETRAEDGHPVIGGDPQASEPPVNEWVYWDHLGRLEFPWDVAITNQLVVSAEYYNVPPHTALRGGITVGSTSGAWDPQLGAMAWISVFPFLSTDPVITRLRRGETYARAEAIELAGAYLVHELGHLLFRLGHPWKNRACLMAAARLLNFRAWRDGLDAGRCPLESSPAMRPGAIHVGGLLPPLRR